MTLEQELAYWRIEEQRLALERKAAWDKDPGNTHPGHVYQGAMGYHVAFEAWEKARDRVIELEAKARAA